MCWTKDGPSKLSLYREDVHGGTRHKLASLDANEGQDRLQARACMHARFGFAVRYSFSCPQARDTHQDQLLV